MLSTMAKMDPGEAKQLSVLFAIITLAPTWFFICVTNLALKINKRDKNGPFSSSLKVDEDCSSLSIVFLHSR